MNTRYYAAAAMLSFPDLVCSCFESDRSSRMHACYISIWIRSGAHAVTLVLYGRRIAREFHMAVGCGREEKEEKVARPLPANSSYGYDDKVLSFLSLPWHVCQPNSDLAGSNYLFSTNTYNPQSLASYLLIAARIRMPILLGRPNNPVPKNKSLV